MRVSSIAALAPALLALAACVPPSPELPAPPVQPSCAAPQLQSLVGTPLSTFNTTTIKGPVRVLAPGSIMTTDYQGHRTNITVNARGMIEKVSCG